MKNIFVVSVLLLFMAFSLFGSEKEEIRVTPNYKLSDLYPIRAYGRAKEAVIPNIWVAKEVARVYLKSVYNVEEKYFPLFVAEKDDKWFIATQTIYFSPHNGRTYYMCIDRFTGEVINIKLMH